MAKKRLLLCWGNPYMFHEVIVPLITSLAKEYKLFIVLQDFYMPHELLELLKLWQRDGLIEGYLIAPNNDHVFKMHWFMRKKRRFLRSFKFDVFLSGSMMQVFERYLLDCIIPRNCVRVCFWPQITYLMENKPLAEKLLNDIEKKSVTAESKISATTSSNIFRRILSKIKSGDSSIDLISKAAALVKYRFLRVYRKKIINYYLNRYLLPMLFLGKSFSLGKYDLLTQLGSGDKNFDAVVFCDEIEVKAYAKLYNSKNIYIAQYSAQENCRCKFDDRKNKSVILSPLSGIIGRDYLTEELLVAFHRDFKIVLRESGAKSVHLRLHPRETGNWPYQLRDYLKNRAIEAEVVACDKPLREVVCDYLGVAGFASCSLRDASFFCDDIFIVGFERVSKKRYTDPKFIYGKGEGLGWINDDGNYDPKIFQRRINVTNKHKDFPLVLREIIKEKML